MAEIEDWNRLDRIDEVIDGWDNQCESDTKYTPFPRGDAGFFYSSFTEFTLIP